jgi:hypothetical protein
MVIVMWLPSGDRALLSLTAWEGRRGVSGASVSGASAVAFDEGTSSHLPVLPHVYDFG